MTQVYDVIVVGAGGAGVAAASRLHEAGCRVLCLEANDHLGGRINTVPFADNIVDLGAQWCHGEKNNAVYTLVKDMNVLGRPGPKAKIFINSEARVPDDSVKIYRDVCLSIIESGKSIEKKSTGSLDDYVRTHFKKYLESEGVQDREVANQILDWFLKSNQAKLTSNDLLNKSLNSLKESWDNDGEQWLNWKGKGYATIMDILLKKHPDPSKELNVEMLFNKEVLNIKWGSQKGTSSNSSPVQITCRDGSLYVSRHAIVTVSLGVLKERYETMFTPSVPDSKIISIRGVAMCTMNKIYIRFPKQWWPEKSMNFELLWKDSDKEQFLDEESWLTEVYSFSTVEHQPFLLCAWVAGTAAENMELQSTHEVLEGIHRLIKYFIGKAYDIPLPSEIRRSTWYTNSLTRGSFSYRSIETECLDASARELSNPLTNSSNVPIVCFAGEATSHHFHSAAHGAVESGFREADRLISILKSK